MGLYTGPEINIVPYFERFIRLKDKIYVANPKDNVSGLVLAKAEEIEDLINSLKQTPSKELDGGILYFERSWGQTLEIIALGSLPSLKIPLKDFELAARQGTVDILQLTCPLGSKVRGVVESKNPNDPNANRKRQF